MKELEYLHNKFSSGVKKVALEYKGEDWWKRFCETFGKIMHWRTGAPLRNIDTQVKKDYIYIYPNLTCTYGSNGLGANNEDLIIKGKLIITTLDEMKAGITIDIDEWLKLMG